MLRCPELLHTDVLSISLNLTRCLWGELFSSSDTQEPSKNSCLKTTPPQEDFKSPPCLKTMLCPPSFRPLPPMMPQLSHPKVLATHLTAMSRRLCGSWHLWVLMNMCIPSRLEQACLLSHRCTVQPQAHHLISLRTQLLIWIWGHPAISAQNFSTSRTGVFEFKGFVWLFCCCFQYN